LTQVGYIYFIVRNQIMTINSNITLCTFEITYLVLEDYIF